MDEKESMEENYLYELVSMLYILQSGIIFVQSHEFNNLQPNTCLASINFKEIICIETCVNLLCVRLRVEVLDVCTGGALLFILKVVRVA